MELGSRRLIHQNVTAHPTAEWTIQQLREALPGEHPHHYLIHDRDSIFSQAVDAAATAMGVKILRTPYRSPQANGRCERLIGTIRRECLEFFIPWNERHLKHILNAWTAHYNRGRPHMALGPGIPEMSERAAIDSRNRHALCSTHRVRSKAVLGGLHHEYTLDKVA
jgi:transposase InsO family protein